MIKIPQIIKRSGDLVQFTPDRITNAIYRAFVAIGERNYTIAEELSKKVVLELEIHFNESRIPSVEEIQDAVEKILIENGHVKVAKAYILYRNERALKRKVRAELASQPSTNIPWAKIWHILDWSVDEGVNTTSGLNQRILKNELPDLVKSCEQQYEIDIENAVEMVNLRKNELRMVIISGPSSSGKTTTTIKIAKRLKRIGLKLRTLNVDNYFFNLEMHPKDEFGDYDFETPQALEISLINQHLSDLISGKEILVPFYDFKTGMRTEQLTPMSLDKNELILIDSLHGLYPDMTQSIASEQKFKLYLEPLLQMKTSFGEYIRWTDLRLMRRMLRDASHRAYDPTKTLLHWHYVRSSEMRNIIPNINTTDYIINSAMPYEICLYNNKLIKDFRNWVDQYQNDPLKVDAFTRAKRTLQVLEEVTPIENDDFVPSDSVIREFIGGSSLSY